MLCLYRGCVLCPRDNSVSFFFRRFCRGFVGRQGFQCQGKAYIAVSDFEEAVFGDRNLDIIRLLFCQGKVAVNCL